MRRAEYAPRLKARLEREDELVTDAEARGWQREVERHQATQRRIRQLLSDLDEDDIQRNSVTSPNAV